MAAARKNPKSNPRRRRRRRRRNPSFDFGFAGLVALGATVIAAGCYAIEGTDLSKAAKGGIELAGSVVVGGATMLVSKGLGAGLMGGGTAVGVKNLGESAAMALSKPAASQPANAGTTSAVRANLGRVQTTMRQLPQSSGTNVYDLFSAVTARV